jgi:hypothetical protein
MAVTLTPRVVGLLVAGALATGWLSASLTQDPAPAQLSRASGPRPLGAPVAMPRTETLRQRLSEPPSPGRGRNPFVYGARAPMRPSVRGQQYASSEAPSMAVAPDVPPMPVFKLSGIASNAEGGVTVLTAILNDNGAMIFVKAGDQLSNGYSVVRVDDSSVTLADATGITQTIRLP